MDANATGIRAACNDEGFEGLPWLLLFKCLVSYFTPTINREQKYHGSSIGIGKESLLIIPKIQGGPHLVEK